MPDWLIHAFGYAVAGAGIYAGIRADLASLHARVKAAADAAEIANRRIDGMLIGKRGMHG